MFTVNFTDGTSMSELNHTWDEVPVNKKVSALQIAMRQGGFITIQEYDQYFFMNESIAWPGQQTAGIAAKIFGGIVEIRPSEACPVCKHLSSNGSTNRLETVCVHCRKRSEFHEKIVLEYRAEFNGNIKTKRYLFSDFRYANHILRPQILTLDQIR